MHLLVTRPKADVADLKTALEAQGHRVSVAPLLEIEYGTTAALDFTGVQAFIATSRNALLGLARTTAIDRARSLPLFAVGPATAALARDLGFAQVIEGAGRAQDLVGIVPRHAAATDGTLLHLAGETLAFDLAGALAATGFKVCRETMYRSVAAKSLSTDIRDDIRAGSLEGVILMSPRTAKVFSDLAFAAKVAEDARQLEYFCLSEAVARGLMALAPSKVKFPRQPTAQEMLAVLAREAPESR